MSEADDLIRQVLMGLYTEDIRVEKPECDAKASIVAYLSNAIMDFVKSCSDEEQAVVAKAALAPAIYFLKLKLKEDIIDATEYEQYIATLVALSS